MRRASIANISAAQTVEDIKKILAEIIKVLNTSRATENTLSASASALSDSLYSHEHDDRYYTEAESDVLLAGKSDVGHSHDDLYYTESEVDTLLSNKADVGHTHDDRYYTESEVDTLLSGKSDVTHDHDTEYYTESEVDTLLSNKSNVGHTHDDRYYTESETDSLLSAKLSDAPSDGTLYGRKDGLWSAVPSLPALGALAYLDTVGTSQINNDAVTYAKIQNVSSTDRILGRSSAGAGDVEEIVCTSVARNLLDDTTTSAQRTTLDVYSKGDVDGALLTKFDLASAGGLATMDTVGTAEIDNLAVTLGKLEWLVQHVINDERLSYKLGTTGWTSVLSGTGAMGQQKPRYNSALRDNSALFMMRVTTAGGTSGTNAAAAYHSTLPLWLSNDSGMSGRCMIETIAQVSVLRWGFIGNDAAPSASAAPGVGCWFSVDPTTYGDNVVRFHCANGGVVTTTTTGITAANNTWYFWAIEFESTSSVKAYFGTTMPTSPTVTHTTNLPNGAQQQQGGCFMQIVKLNPSTSDWSGLIIPEWRIHLATTRFQVRYS